ncbi:MAG: enoyl-CoA hydratase [Gordonia sp.]|uniref:Enoyl-CoA hydratase-related protein n=1 Tax=Gordonia rubripertincta TaxID=36822 RepID=A0ABT4MWC3_GORRU|nr:enoyl-CoA hydratase-related protein [Gordonia rubripertincta]MBA4024554.1 enoyl-CoA hydratase [Gordonia sp. (in: high G+C Gram-positive bacteria)]MCZ4551310.1 enoyl-CoA hydratase-related protein [Gordonia rubripertincta]
MTTGTEQLELVQERRGPILILRLNRPDARNALNGSLIQGIGTAALDAEADPEIRALVLTGTGDRAFCAGMDLRAFADGGNFYSEGFERLAEGHLSIPVIGAANGTAIGGGLELLLGCDVIVSSSQAKFGLPEVKRGMFPGGGGTNIGTRIPLGIALEMTLTGDFITAERAYEIGLVNALAAPDAVLETAIGYAERIAANAPLSLAACKELVRLAVTNSERVPERLGQWQKTVFSSSDAKEGATAFIEKRSPNWQGR